MVQCLLVHIHKTNQITLFSHFSTLERWLCLRGYAYEINVHVHPHDSLKTITIFKRFKSLIQSVPFSFLPFSSIPYYSRFDAFASAWSSFWLIVFLFQLLCVLLSFFPLVHTIYRFLLCFYTKSVNSVLITLPYRILVIVSYIPSSGTLFYFPPLIPRVQWNC